MSLAERWGRYWFADAPYFDLALMRIAVAGFQFYFLLDTQYASLQYVLSLPHDLFHADARILRLFLWPMGWHTPPSAELVYAVFWITLVAGLGAVFGALTTISVAVFALGNLLIQAYLFSFTDYHHPEAIAILGTMALALSPCGRVLSVDNLVRRWRSSGAGEPATTVPLLDLSGPYAGWPILFIQWFFPLMYISAAVAKLAFSDYTLHWANGYTLQYYMIQDYIRKDAVLGLVVAPFHWPIVLGQYVVLIYQLTYFLVVPFKKLRWIYLPLGLTFHLANFFILRAPFPQWIMFLLLAYIPWSTTFKMLAAARVPAGLPAARPGVTTGARIGA